MIPKTALGEKKISAQPVALHKTESICLRDGWMSITRVVVISDDTLATGGASGVALGEIRELVRRGIPVTLISGHLKVAPELEHLGIEIVSLGGATLLERSRSTAAWKGIFDPHTMKRI